MVLYYLVQYTLMLHCPYHTYMYSERHSVAPQTTPPSPTHRPDLGEVEVVGDNAGAQEQSLAGEESDFVCSIQRLLQPLAVVNDNSIFSCTCSRCVDVQCTMYIQCTYGQVGRGRQLLPYIACIMYYIQNCDRRPIPTATQTLSLCPFPFTSMCLCVCLRARDHRAQQKRSDQTTPTSN